MTFKNPRREGGQKTVPGDQGLKRGLSPQWTKIEEKSIMGVKRGGGVGKGQIKYSNQNGPPIELTLPTHLGLVRGERKKKGGIRKTEQTVSTP